MLAAAARLSQGQLRADEWGHDHGNVQPDCQHQCQRQEQLPVLLQALE
jgi:hypothetical protein